MPKLKSQRLVSETQRGLCKWCGINPVKRCGVYWLRSCKNCERKPYLRHIEKIMCSQCGFKPKHTAQLDVDHIDGDHHNNDMSNLQVLCANCHRLKSVLERSVKFPPMADNAVVAQQKSPKRAKRGICDWCKAQGIRITLHGYCTHRSKPRRKRQPYID